jgi:hypothetical protein
LRQVRSPAAPKITISTEGREIVSISSLLL